MHPIRIGDVFIAYNAISNNISLTAKVVLLLHVFKFMMDAIVYFCIEMTEEEWMARDGAITLP